MSSRRWQTGLHLPDPHGYSDLPYFTRGFFRWLFEFLTQVAGWNNIDAEHAGWTSVVASGSDGATPVGSNDIFTTATAPFTAADANEFLTITGVSSPDEELNGIYKIKRVISSSQVLLDTRFSVHSDGLPSALSGLNWRLWRLGSSANIPAFSTFAVVGGHGRVGAGLNNATGSGDSFSVSGTDVTLTDTAANFQSSDIGKDITITGATTSSHNGTFTISTIISPAQVRYINIASPPSEVFPGTWTISYLFHLHMTIDPQSTDPTRLGAFIISPFASWNAGTNSWNDARYTSSLAVSWSQPIDRLQSARVWAVADPDSVTIYMRTERGYYGWAQNWIVFQFGEIDTFYPTLDPRPAIVLCSYSRYDFNYAIGTGTNWQSSPSGGIRMLSYDDTTTLVGYLSFPHSPYSVDYNWLSRQRRRISEFSKKMYLIPLIVESRTASHMELRGTLRNMKYTAQQQPFCLMPFGESKNLIHVNGGLVVPWHGGQQWYELAGRAGPQ